MGKAGEGGSRTKWGRGETFSMRPVPDSFAPMERTSEKNVAASAGCISVGETNPCHKILRRLSDLGEPKKMQSTAALPVPMAFSSRREFTKSLRSAGTRDPDGEMERKRFPRDRSRIGVQTSKALMGAVGSHEFSRKLWYSSPNVFGALSHSSLP